MHGHLLVVTDDRRPARLTVDGAMLDATTRQFRVLGRRSALVTPTEMLLLAYLMRNAGRVITRAALIDAVWGGDPRGYGHRLDVHLCRLRAKIEADPSAPRYLCTVRGCGYLFRSGKASDRWRVIQGGRARPAVLASSGHVRSDNDDPRAGTLWRKRGGGDDTPVSPNGLNTPPVRFGAGRRGNGGRRVCE